MIQFSGYTSEQKGSRWWINRWSLDEVEKNFRKTKRFRDSIFFLKEKIVNGRTMSFRHDPSVGGRPIV